MFRKCSWAAAWLVFSVSVAMAEIDREYFPIIVDSESPNVMALAGTIDGRTALNFERAIEHFGVPDVLVLASDGGQVYQALIIARRVHALGIDTLVPEDSGCYSACSFVFLGGIVRSADGELGVHQISSDTGDLESGQVSISDILDTLDGFNVPNALLVDMFRTPPGEIYILSNKEKSEYAFIAPRRNSLSSRQEQSPSASIEERAFGFLIDYQSAWSQPNDLAIRSVMPMYANSVQFYGKHWSSNQVRSDKLGFSERWPTRTYQVIGDTVSISCDVRYCYVGGDVNWAVSNSQRGDSTSGVMRVDMKLELIGQSFKIVAEDGHVVRRN